MNEHQTIPVCEVKHESLEQRVFKVEADQKDQTETHSNNLKRIYDKIELAFKRPSRLDATLQAVLAAIVGAEASIIGVLLKIYVFGG